MKTWLVPVSINNWRIYKDNNFKFLAFPYRKRNSVSQISVGDSIVLYLASRVSVLTGILIVKSSLDIKQLNSPKTYRRKIDLKWEELYPCRVQTETLKILREEEFVNIKQLIGKLEFIVDKENYFKYLQHSLIPLGKHDFKLIERVIKQSLNN
jgi:predicted RNA-binding protein